MPVDYVAMGRRIRRKRQEMGLTQGELASRLNISLSYYGHIERGSRTPSLETLIIIANALNVGADYILRDSLVVPYNQPPKPLYTSRDLHMLRAYLQTQQDALDHWLDSDDTEEDSEDEVVG